MKKQNLGSVVKTRYGLSIKGREGEKVYQEALGRIGSTAEKKCRWFLRFAELNFKMLTHKEWLELAEARKVLTSKTGNFNAAVYSDKAARRDQEEIQQFLTSLRTEKLVSTPGVFTKMFMFMEGELRGVHVITTELFLGAFGEILWAVKDKFRACERCDKFYVATKRQTYCSSTCSQTTRTSRYRAKARLGTSRQSGNAQTRKRGKAR